MNEDAARAAFLDHLDRGREEPLDSTVTETLLSDTTTVLPERGCDQLGVEHGTSYAHAVTALILRQQEQTD